MELDGTGGPASREFGEVQSLDETLAGDDAEVSGPVHVYSPGATVGRYVILEEVGAGGMGVVLAAFDPQLNRKIALKILHPRRRSPTKSSGPARARLMREAQAIAKLSHPNVISVYDVGAFGDAVFVAMEFIEGQTLTSWLDDSRDASDIVSAFVQAGRGLAAAHRAGLVHRDFKPDNVLVGSDGLVRVSDFGLARTDPTLSQEASESADFSPEMEEQARATEGSDAEVDVLSSPLTQAGAVVGTPRYMSPEQHAGTGTDARSDQFSFCVALYQALYKQEPFQARTLESLAVAKQDGNVTRIPSGPRVPLYLEAVVLQGLSPRPRDRFSSMGELVAALERDPATRRRKVVLGGAAAVVLGAAAAGLGYMQALAGPACEGAEARLESVWGEGRKDKVREALLATGVEYADASWGEVERKLDRYAEQWAATHTAACEATHVSHEQSGALLDLRMVCLGRCLSAMRATVDVLTNADAGVVQRAAQAVAGLPTLDACSNTEFLLAQVEPASDSATADSVAAMRELLLQARVLNAAGRYTQGLGLARQALAAADRIDYAPVRAEALFALGTSLENTGAYKEAEAALTDAVWTAIRSKHDEYAARSAIQLVGIVGDRLARHAEGLQWEQHARSILDRLALGGLNQAVLDMTAGNVLYRMGDVTKALEYYQRAIAMKEAVSGPDDPDLSAWLINLGNAQYGQGHFDEAIATYQRALDIAEATVGKQHPIRATALASIGTVYHDLDRFAEAERYLEEALPMFRQALGNKHPFVAATLTNLALGDMALGRHREAVDRIEAALAIYAEAVGTRHPDYARALHNSGRAHVELGDLDVARAKYERALRIRRKVMGPEHIDVAASLQALAELDARAGDHEGARKGFESALAIYAEGEADRREVARCRFGLAKTLKDLGKKPAARNAGEQARLELAREGTRAQRELSEVDAWLDKL